MAKMGSVSVQMKDLLDEFSDELDKLVKDSAKETAKECATKLKSSSPKGPRGYAQSWTTKEKDGGWVVYNAKHYQLTHLLENSHVIRNRKNGPAYGRTSPGHGQIIHIAPVAEEGINGLAKYLIDLIICYNNAIKSLIEIGKNFNE